MFTWLLLGYRYIPMKLLYFVSRTQQVILLSDIIGLIVESKNLMFSVATGYSVNDSDEVLIFIFYYYFIIITSSALKPVLITISPQ